MREKAWSKLLDTVHWRPENSHLGIQIVHNWLRKSSYALCESCKGSGDLQLCYSLLGPLLFNFLEICSVKQGHLEKFRAPGVPDRRATSSARSCTVAAAVPTVGPTRTPRPHGLHAACAGRLDGASAAPPCHPVRATRRARLGRLSRPCAARPTASSPYSAHARRHAMPMPRSCRGNDVREPPPQALAGYKR
jgi:hypothetical protein